MMTIDVPRRRRDAYHDDRLLWLRDVICGRRGEPARQL